MQPVDYIPRIRDNYTPQYQDEEDRRLAEEGGGRSCPVCRS